MSEVKTIRFTVEGLGAGMGRPKLDDVFADAEQWFERDEDADGWTVAWRCFVRHPKYPACTMMVEATMEQIEGAGPGVVKVVVRRVITDNGRTPIKALQHIALYSMFVMDFTRRGGGPAETPEEMRIAIVKGWREVKGKSRKPQEVYALEKGISARQLRKWERDLEAEGKL